MRGIYSNKTKVRHDVFKEVARMAFEGGDFSRIDELPYKLVPGEVGKNYDNIFLERAIIGERLRATIGLPIRNITEHSMLSDGILNESVYIKRRYSGLDEVFKFFVVDASICGDFNKALSALAHCIE